ncbi:MAG: phosphoribosyl-ATP diphosphatase [bacterium]|nr:phosphoribosyl-ATP diphosphatase [bacterium]
MAEMLPFLETLIAERKANPQPNSYTNKLLSEGLHRTAQKVGEEAVEVVVAALTQEREAQVGELADLFYHTLVLMAQLEISLSDVNAELEARHRK